MPKKPKQWIYQDGVLEMNFVDQALRRTTIAGVGTGQTISHIRLTIHHYVQSTADTFALLDSEFQYGLYLGTNVNADPNVPGTEPSSWLLWGESYHPPYRLVEHNPNAAGDTGAWLLGTRRIVEVSEGQRIRQSGQVFQIICREANQGPTSHNYVFRWSLRYLRMEPFA